MTKLTLPARAIFFSMILSAITDFQTLARDDNSSIPQDKTSIEILRKERRDHARKIFVESYEKYGKKSSAWDDAANKCVAAAAEVWGGPHVATSMQKLSCANFGQEAIKQGCTDPLIVALTLTCGPVNPTMLLDFDKNLIVAWNELNTSQYGNVPRAIMLRRMLAFAKDTKAFRPNERSTMVKSCGKVFCNLMKDNWQINREVADDLVDEAFLMSARNGDSLESTWRVIDQSCGDYPADGWIRHAIKGNYHLVRGWEKRGEDVASTVKDDDAEFFRKELLQAKKCFEASWSKYSKHMIYGESMMEIAKGLGLPREETNLWFRRAMKLNGDDVRVCMAMADYLHPKWGGSAEDLIEFGRQCAATRNYHSGIPAILYEAHMHAFSTDTIRHFAKKDVYEETELMLRSLITDQPLAVKQRWRYALLAYNKGKYELARTHFDKLGESPPYDLMDGKVKYDLLKKELDAKAPVNPRVNKPAPLD